jgi:hypothetical protein
MENLDKILIAMTGLLFLFTFITGGLLAANSGKDETITATVHKLLALLTLVVTAVTIYMLAKGK